jgi:hypothetical protein
VLNPPAINPRQTEIHLVARPIHFWRSTGSSAGRSPST